jgi:hypothetical protein
MHGIIFNQFYKFIREAHGFDMLSQIKKESSIGHKFHDATKAHPDEELISILEAGAKVTGVPRDKLLESFGRHIVPNLLQTYKAYIDGKWKSLDMLESVESVMHKAVRATNPEAAPPELSIKRVSDKEVHIEYFSKRNMLSFGLGLIQGIGDHYSERFSITVIRKSNASLVRVIKI